MADVHTELESRGIPTDHIHTETFGPVGLSMGAQIMAETFDAIIIGTGQSGPSLAARMSS